MPPGFNAVDVLNTWNASQLPEIQDCLRVHLRRENLTLLKLHKPHDGVFVIVGGAPSIKRTWERVQNLKNNGATVFAMNDAAVFLDEKGIKVDGCVVWEVRVMMAWLNLAKTPVDTTYYICTRAHPDFYCTLRNYPIVSWHACSDIEKEIVPQFLDGEQIYIAGGCSAALRSIEIGRCLGFRKFHLFGIDSSLDEENEQTHAYYHQVGNKKFFKAWCGGKTFTTTHYWGQQTLDLKAVNDMYERLERDVGEPFSLCVHGDGLLPTYASLNGIIVCP